MVVSCRINIYNHKIIFGVLTEYSSPNIDQYQLQNLIYWEKETAHLADAEKIIIYSLYLQKTTAEIEKAVQINILIDKCKIYLVNPAVFSYKNGFACIIKNGDKKIPQRFFRIITH